MEKNEKKNQEILNKNLKETIEMMKKDITTSTTVLVNKTLENLNVPPEKRDKLVVIVENTKRKIQEKTREIQISLFLALSILNRDGSLRNAAIDSIAHIKKQKKTKKNRAKSKK